MTHTPPKLPVLHRQCALLRQEIIYLSGMTETELRKASSFLDQVVSCWYVDDGQTDPDKNPFVYFEERIKGGLRPWPYDAESQLNGFTLSQVYLTWAFSEISHSMANLENSDPGFRTSLGLTASYADWAARNAMLAVQAVMEARLLRETKADSLFQDAGKSPDRLVA